ncbi:hypothetical protein J2850_000656 [Azospirillum picis]|uniref:Uncharacterized protein n=1 Tax=Azospirillum picis TaxID=488438 RepID=A0ABU0MEF4_9PROT|nr:hypothetical protein [Azospirillum picis]MDQ0531820.1 hypothetical protein [Azospirillum picis]
MNPEDFEQISAEMSKYMNYLMNRVVKRVQDVADDE